MTGFVVGHPQAAPAGVSAVKAIEDVLEDEPALDAEILELGRWAAAYYLAPLGEVLRAALPQGERAAASTRRVRLTEQGRLFLRRDQEGKGGLQGLALDDARSRAAAPAGAPARGWGVRGLAGTAQASARLQRFVELGWVEVGDEVSGQSQGRQQLWAVPEPDAAAARLEAAAERSAGALRAGAGKPRRAGG